MHIVSVVYNCTYHIKHIYTHRDPIDYVKKLLVDNEMATAEELKAIEKDIRNDVQLRSV